MPYRANRSPLDQKIQGLVSTAEKAVRSALELAAQADPETYGRVYVARVKRDLSTILGAMQRVRPLTPRYELQQPEREKPEKIVKPVESAPLDDLDDMGDEYVS